jgi:hypothetical protein
VASKVALRIVTCQMYYDAVKGFGPTVRMHAPIERERFTIAKVSHRGATPPGKPVIGFSGYAYTNQRKGEDMVAAILNSKVGQGCEFRGSGRGWPVPTRKYTWAEMPGFYQGLDVLVCTSRVEGIPMPPLEALSCGVPIVIPRGVGMLDELLEMPGIYRYERGDIKSLLLALEQWEDTQRAGLKPAPTDGFREALRAATVGHSVQAWVEEHRTAFEAMGNGEKATANDANGREWEDRAGYGVPKPAPTGLSDEIIPVIRAEIPVIVAGNGAKEGINEGKILDSDLRRNDDPPGLRRNDEDSRKGANPRVREGQRGIYVVAFGGPARETAARLIESIATFMPDVPVCLVGSEPLEGMDESGRVTDYLNPPLQFIKYPDNDIGGRRAKLAIYELAPAEWQQILYLDADTVLTAPVYALFDWIERGWEFVICRDLYPRDTLSAFQQRYDKNEVAEMIELLRCWEVQQLNGGVWSFGRSERTAAFFASFREEYERYCARDQGALLRALYKHPLKMLVLGNEWNTFPRFQNGQVTAGILHYPQEARRWKGQINGRIDSPAAWQAVRKFEAQGFGRGGRGQ